METKKYRIVDWLGAAVELYQINPKRMERMHEANPEKNTFGFIEDLAIRRYAQSRTRLQSKKQEQEAKDHRDYYNRSKI
jgi:hypothetical protein